MLRTNRVNCHAHQRKRWMLYRMRCSKKQICNGMAQTRNAGRMYYYTSSSSPDFCPSLASFLHFDQFVSFRSYFHVFSVCSNSINNSSRICWCHHQVQSHCPHVHTYTHALHRRDPNVITTEIRMNVDVAFIVIVANITHTHTHMAHAHSHERTSWSIRIHRTMFNWRLMDWAFHIS